MIRTTNSQQIGYPAKSAAEAQALIRETQQLIEAIQPRSIIGLRDRAIIGVMGYALASLDAVLALRVRDYYGVGKRPWIRLNENGIERSEIVDRKLERYIDEYLTAAQIADEPWSPLFRTTLHGSSRVSARPVARRNILETLRHLVEHVNGMRRTEISHNEKSECYIELIDSIKPNGLLNLRDRAILGLMLYASVSPKVISSMRVRDYYVYDNQHRISLAPHGSIEAVAPLVTLLRDYLAAARLRRNPGAPLFALHRNRSMTASEIQKMLRQRITQAGIATGRQAD